MKVYLAGYISGNVMDQCVAWRKQICDHYNNWKGQERYPIEWLDPLNSGESDSIDPEGLKSDLPPNMIVHKDLMAVKHSDLIVANLDTFGESRPLIGTACELAWSYLLDKPIIVISDNPQYTNHPFIKVFASVIVNSVEEMLEKKYINKFYKTIVTAEYKA